MMEEQQETKNISSLKYSIQKHVILRDMFCIDEAHNKALMIERLQKRAPLSGIQCQLKSQHFSKVLQWLIR